ncbi:hypothetical protein [Eggerthella timonensis]|uniref:hypothetical protein n=1 Tax=Eggerthella timonensis TaxID=1871008 RepID=UPI000C7748D1|nr:hypothetical protein [Eggerthella timonensis]
MPIKNYTTKIAAVRTVGEIQEILGTHGAKGVLTEYGADGKVGSVSFSYAAAYGDRSFRLPANVSGVHGALIAEGVKCDRDQAERVAWRILRDWVDAQMAIVEAGQASVDEVFMPYMLDGGRTLYAAYAGMLGEGASER